MKNKLDFSLHKLQLLFSLHAKTLLKHRFCLLLFLAFIYNPPSQNRWKVTKKKAHSVQFKERRNSLKRGKWVRRMNWRWLYGDHGLYQKCQLPKASTEAAHQLRALQWKLKKKTYHSFKLRPCVLPPSLKCLFSITREGNLWAQIMSKIPKEIQD